MKRILRRLITLSMVAALGVGGYFMGRSYLFPPRDFKRLRPPGMPIHRVVRMLKQIRRSLVG